MKHVHFYFLTALIAFAFVGCSKKSSDSSAPTSIDYATPACGVYHSTYTSNLTDTVFITKMTDSTVRVKCNFPDIAPLGCSNVKVRASNGKSLLNLGSYLQGSVTGKVLDLKIWDTGFKGEKP